VILRKVRRLQRPMFETALYRRLIMKTDAELKRDVNAELAWDPAINASAIGVAVKDGVVTLSGHLDTYAEKVAVERALRRVVGVKAIALELDIRLSPTHRRSDTDIANTIESTLRWNGVVPTNKVRVIVDKGWVTLQGEVDWDFQRRSVEKAIRPLIGVVGINNEIAIKASVAPADVARRIREALTRQTEREVDHLDVRTEGGTVTLRGKVHSWHERDAAQGAAWAAPGVRAVINDLTIND
jgi:osmotically-inducible protein OsmY